jgi:hypothetical protein
VEELEGDVPLEANVTRPVHHAHAAGPENSDDLVGTNPRAGSQGHSCEGIALSGEKDHSRRTHGRQVRSAVKRWHDFLIAGRDWRLGADAPWEASVDAVRRAF